jgi:AcrR family transcriptional regulator
MEQIGLRERKKLRTRESIERAAIDLALEHGFDHLTVEMIAEHAEVTSRTFFNHFADKESAILGIPRDRSMILGDVELAQEGLTGLEFGVALLHAHLEVLTPEIFELDVRRRAVLAAHPHLMAREMEKFGLLEDVFTDAVMESLASTPTLTAAEKRVHARAVVFIVIGAARLAMEAWTATPETTMSLAEHFDSALETITNITLEGSVR